MREDRFNKIIAEQLSKTADLLCEKGHEYAPYEDRLDAFRQAAELQHCTMPVALGGMMAKHIVSIYQMIPDADCYTSEKWDEKINDAINYLLLLKACILDDEGDE